MVMDAPAACSRSQEEAGAASIQISIDAIDLEINLVDSDVRKVLSALHGTNKQTYAGSSSSTPEGRAFLQQELDGLLAAKAQYKEIKAARVQLQRDLPLQAIDSEIARVDAEVMALLGAIQQGGSVREGSHAGKSTEALKMQLDRLSKEKAQYKEKKLSVVLLQQDEKVVQQPPADLAGIQQSAVDDCSPVASPYSEERLLLFIVDTRKAPVPISSTAAVITTRDWCTAAVQQLSGECPATSPTCYLSTWCIGGRHGLHVYESCLSYGSAVPCFIYLKFRQVSVKAKKESYFITQGYRYHMSTRTL